MIDHVDGLRDPAEYLHRLRDAVEALPVEYREAIVLRELEGLSYHQIAQIARIIAPRRPFVPCLRKRVQVQRRRPFAVFIG